MSHCRTAGNDISIFLDVQHVELLTIKLTFTFFFDFLSGRGNPSDLGSSDEPSGAVCLSAGSRCQCQHSGQPGKVYWTLNDSPLLCGTLAEASDRWKDRQCLTVCVLLRQTGALHRLLS